MTFWMRRVLGAAGYPGVGGYHFDAIGVPSPEEMARRFGGGRQWQRWAMREWAARLARNEDGVAVAVLDAQIPPAVARAALRAAGVRRARIVLVDCGPASRRARLYGPRGQPELAGADMVCGPSAATLIGCTCSLS